MRNLHTAYLLLKTMTNLQDPNLLYICLRTDCDGRLDGLNYTIGTRISALESAWNHDSDPTDYHHFHHL